MNPVLRRSAAHLFVESLAAPSIANDDQHHLARVLRLRDGEGITLSDGAGNWCPASWVGTDGSARVCGEVHAEPRAAELVVGCAIPKGDRPELVVQKLTEIGIDRILFFESTRSVVHWSGDRRDKQLGRLRRVAREAASQSRRVWLPDVGVCSFADAMALDGVVIAEPGATGRLQPTTRGVLIGPEGGYDEAELAMDLPQVALGPTVLRVETAAIVAAAGLVAWRF